MVTAFQIGGKEGTGAVTVEIEIADEIFEREAKPEPPPKFYPFLPWDNSMGYHPDGDIKVPHEMISPLHARRAQLEQEIAEIDRQLEKLAQPRSLGPLPERILRLMSSC